MRLQMKAENRAFYLLGMSMIVKRNEIEEKRLEIGNGDVLGKAAGSGGQKSYQAGLTPLSIAMEGQDFLRHMFWIRGSRKEHAIMELSS